MLAGLPRMRQGERVVHRTARVELRVTPAQRERCFGLLGSGGDLWAAVLELNALRRRRGDAPIVTDQDLCSELARSGPGCAGSLSSTGARTILRRYSDAWFAAAARRRAGDLRPHFPRGLGAEHPLTPRGWRSCTVELAGTCPARPGVTLQQVAMDHHRHLLGPWPAVARPEDLGESLDRDATAA